MTLNEVLSLDKVNTSVRQIDIYMSKQKQTSFEYLRALAYKCEILHFLNKTKDALRLLLPLKPYFDQFSNESVISICNVLIDILFDISNYDQALIYIDIKKSKLKTIDSEQYTFDMIRYYNFIGQKDELKRNIIIYLNNDVSVEKKIYVLELLIKYQYIDKEYDGFEDSFDRLKEYYKDELKYDELQALYIKMTDVYMRSNKYIEASKLIDSYIDNDYNTIDTRVKAISYKMRILLINNQANRASLLESEYHDLYEKCDGNDSKEAFARVALDVAQRIGDNVAKKEYEEHLEAIQASIKEEKKTTKKEKKKAINITIVENQEDNTLVIDDQPKPAKQEAAYVKKEGFVEAIIENEPDIIEVSRNYKSIEEVLESFNTKQIAKFRDVLMNYGIAIENKFSKCEIVISLKDNPLGYHYKVGRVYKKTFDDEALIDTPAQELMNNSKKLYLHDIKTSLFDKNIITKLPYDDEFKTVIGFRLYRNGNDLGSILYEFFTTEFKDKLIYEALRMLTNMLVIYLNRELDEIEATDNNKMLEFINKHSTEGVKSEIDMNITLNETAMAVLDVKYSTIETPEFIALIDSKDAKNYKDLIDSIYNGDTNEATIYYSINGKYIKEEFMVDRASELKIYSIVSDCTAQKEKEDKLIQKASKDSLSKLNTKEALYNDINSLLESKHFALAIVALSNYSSYNEIYGYEFADDLVYAVGKTLNKIGQSFPGSSFYHLDNDRFMILYKDNDQRAILKRTKDILNKLSKELENINYRLKTNFKAGVFRYTKAMNITDIRKIIWFASEGLIDAYESTEYNAVCMYNDDTSKERFRESQLLLHISEAIDQNILQIKYKQLINLKEELMEYYFARIDLVNFSVREDYIESVLIKRDKIELLDKYIVQQVLGEEKTFYTASSTYYRALIPMHKSTMMSTGFIKWLESQLKFFKIPSSAIGFYLIEDNNLDMGDIIRYLKSKNINVASYNFDFAIRNNCAMYFCDTTKYNSELVLVLKKACDDIGIRFVASNISKIEEVSDCRNNEIELIYGPIARGTYTIKDIVKTAQEK